MISAARQLLADSLRPYDVVATGTCEAELIVRKDFCCYKFWHVRDAAWSDQLAARVAISNQFLQSGPVRFTPLTWVASALSVTRAPWIDGRQLQPDELLDAIRGVTLKAGLPVGDLSGKNMLVDPAGVIWVLDFSVTRV